MTTNPQRTHADLVVIGLLLVGVGMAFGQWWAPQAGPADTALVFVGGGEYARLPLHVDTRLEVAGAIGISRLQVADGGIRFADSPCRHKLCVRAGFLRHGHDAAACVPNRVSVALTGGNRSYDSINF